MNTGFVKTVVALVTLFTLSACATPAAKPLISAEEFDAMINIEVRTIEPLREEEVTVAAAN